MGARPLAERTLAALRPAFAREVAERVPGMHAATAEVLAEGAVPAARRLRRDVHTLASSAALLGERVVSVHARRCEQLLDDWCDRDVTVPRDVAAAIAREVETLTLLLAGWIAVRGAA